MEGKSLLRSVSWLGVVTGAVVAALLADLLADVVALPMSSHLYEIFESEAPGDVTVFTSRAWYAYEALSALISLSCLMLAFCVGGFVAGTMAFSLPGVHGAVAAAATAIIGFLWIVWGLLPWAFIQSSNPGDLYTRSENLGNLMVLVAVFCVVFPLAVLTGYLGGKLGGRLRGRATARSTT